MFYCINYFINSDKIVSLTSILFKKIDNIYYQYSTDQNKREFQIISTFEKNSIHINLLISEFVKWFNKFLIEYNFNYLNFAFINYNDFFCINKLGNLLMTHYSNVNIPEDYSNIRIHIPEVFSYYYSINQLFINTYGFNNQISIKSMKRFLQLQIDEYYVRNIEANYLLYIFIRVINDYGARINNFQPTIIF
jgi:hypothetical protein